MIIQCATTSFKTDLLQGEHNFDTDTFKIALYSSVADLGPDATVYTTTNEVSGTGYSAGGATLSLGAVSYGNNAAWVPMESVSWAGASFTASGAMIYNASNGNKSVMILSFGLDRSFSSTSNTINFPADGASTSLIRIY